MYTIDLSSATDITQVGGKAAHLQRAISLGLPVPPGLVVSRLALTRFLEDNGLTVHVREIIESDHLPEGQFADLCAHVLAAPIPPAIQEQVNASVRDVLASAPVGLAVRSSGVHEDSIEASFAGTYQSFLGISTIEDLWNCIRQCWCSSWSSQAIAYARRMDISLAPDQMAVIVQHVVPADSAGVVFTADPLTGNPWRFVISATFGLAQGLVSGDAPADRFIVSWDNGAILERRIADKPAMIVPSESGVARVAVPVARQRTPSLTDDVVREIAALALQIDQALERRMDVEWAVADDRVSVVQVRPIAALPQFFPHELAGEDAEATWTLQDPLWFRGVKEGRQPIAPLFQDTWATEKWLRYQPTGEGTKVFARPMGRERDFHGYRYTTRWVWGGPWHDHSRTERWLDEHEPTLRADWERRVHELSAHADRTRRALKDAKTASDLIPTLLHTRDWAVDMEAASFAAPQSMHRRCETLLKLLLQDVAPEYPMGKLLQGLPCYSYQRIRAAQKLARSIREDVVRQAFEQQPLAKVIPYLAAHCPGSDFLEAYRVFCWRFGLPTLLNRPREAWDRPHRIALHTLLAIKNAALGRGRDVDARLARLAADRLAAEQEIEAIIRQNGGDVARFLKILSWAQFWVPALDNRMWVGAAYARLEALVERTGEMLVREGVIKVPSEILLFKPEDLTYIASVQDAGSRRRLFIARKQAYERQRRLTPPKHLGKPAKPSSVDHASQGKTPAQIQEPSGTVLKGQGLSPGYVVGVSRRVGDLTDSAVLSALSDQDILVSTDFAQGCYADWFSLLLVVKGLVTTWGDMLHHATQVARELGVVFVNLPEAYGAHIPDNAHIAVDGERGIVEITSMRAGGR